MPSVSSATTSPLANYNSSGAVPSTSPSASVASAFNLPGTFAPSVSPTSPATLLSGSEGDDGSLDSYAKSIAGASITTEATPGDYYCGHMFYVTQQYADQPNSGVARDARGDAAVGFLHVPEDAYATGTGGSYNEATRQAATQHVVGAALQGYYNDALAAAGQGPVKIMLNGYGPFQNVTNNPTQEFVNNPANIDAAMSNAFGSNLVTPHGTVVPDGVSPGTTYAYTVRDPTSGQNRQVEIHAGCFNVDNSAIDGQAGSVQAAMQAFKPQAILSMGYDAQSSSSYEAEHYADNGDLAPSGSGYTDSPGTAATAYGDDYSLEDALSAYKAPPT